MSRRLRRVAYATLISIFSFTTGISPSWAGKGPPPASSSNNDDALIAIAVGAALVASSVYGGLGCKKGDDSKRCQKGSGSMRGSMISE